MAHSSSKVPIAMIEETETATAVEAAALLVGLATQDTRQPIAELGNALERIHRAVTGMAAAQHDRSGRPTEQQQEMIRDLTVCIENLQFHDRLMQQLAFVRDLLSAILKHEPLDVAAYGAPRWEALMELIRRRAPLDSRFELFDLLLPAQARSEEGSCELFE
ncbi:MAG TPA: hypothetical protein VMT29_22125 [Steroidobacteraceae bacterium]|nr:hypothetical protein [Steroidobacteraceae bacterium]